MGRWLLAHTYLGNCVEGRDLVFETKSFQNAVKPYCNGTHHVLNRELYGNLDVVNQELGDLFRRPVQELTED